MKQIEVKINGVTYLPVDPTQDPDKPEGEPTVNYRALVNDKLRELGTFYEKEGTITTNREVLLLVPVSHASDVRFIVAGRVQEVLLDIAYYLGDEEYSLKLSLKTLGDWKSVYGLLLDEDNEHFIKTGERN